MCSRKDISSQLNCNHHVQIRECYIISVFETLDNNFSIFLYRDTVGIRFYFGYCCRCSISSPSTISSSSTRSLWQSCCLFGIFCLFTSTCIAIRLLCRCPIGTIICRSSSLFIRTYLFVPIVLFIFVSILCTIGLFVLLNSSWDKQSSKWANYRCIFQHFDIFRINFLIFFKKRKSIVNLILTVETIQWLCERLKSLNSSVVESKLIFTAVTPKFCGMCPQVNLTFITILVLYLL